MQHLRSINRKAARVVGATTDPARDVLGLQQPPLVPHIPIGCTLVFHPGWETDAAGGTAGLCQPVEGDIFDCYLGCYWPAQVPDQLNYASDWTSACAAAVKDWQKIDLIFP
jgi:hypothetical protein